MPRLENKVALVTGAARGIGEAIARAFAAEGAVVWLTDLAPPAALAEELGLSARSARLDVRLEEDWRRVVEALMERDCHLDVLVNNAGVTGFEAGARPHDPEHASLADWRAVHETNLDGVFLGCREALRAMRVTGAGSIINVSSRSGLVGVPGAAAYASSKAAVRNHTKSVALWAAQQGLAVRCNSIHPAAILTPMWEPMLGEGAERAGRMAALTRDTPLKRFGTAEEVARDRDLSRQRRGGLRHGCGIQHRRRSAGRFGRHAGLNRNRAAFAGRPVDDRYGLDALSAPRPSCRAGRACRGPRRRS